MRHSGPIPQRKKVLAVYEMRESESTPGALRISQATGVPRSSVSLWIGKPHAFDPYYDPIAIARAMGGDGEVFDRLTTFEYRLVVALLERADTAGSPVSDRFPFSHKEKIRVAVRRRRDRVEAPRPSHHRIAETKLTPGACAKVKEMRQKGIDFAVIGRQLGLSRSSVFRALKNAA